MIIVDLIKELMYQQNKSVSDLVKETGLAYEIIERTVIRDIAPSPENAEKMLNCLGITLAEVLMLY